MQKTILITGATDGIGLQAAQQLAELGHTLLIHGRNPEKIKKVKALLAKTKAKVYTYQADFSDLEQVKKMAKEIQVQHQTIDVIINNAGILKSVSTPSVKSLPDIDIRFRVNTLAPYILTKRLLGNLTTRARVVNLGSAAQAPFDLNCFNQKAYTDAMQAYSESKLALITWSMAMAKSSNHQGIQFLAINPGSLLATKMVKEGFGIEGKDASIGADLLVETALGDKFENANGRYFDNDIGQFSQSHQMAMDLGVQKSLLESMNRFL